MLLTKQKAFIHFQRSYSILAAGTLIQQATRFSNIYFPGNGFIRLFAPFVTAKPFQIPTDNKSVLVNSKIEVKDEISKLDTSKKSNNLNKNITDILKELAKKEKAAGDFYRARAYHFAIKSIEAYPKKINSGKEARELRFIGPSIEMKIDEILEKGACSYVSGYPDSTERQLFNVLIKIPRIGRVNAHKYISKGYKSLEELINDPDLQPDQKYLIEHIKELNEKIPKWEMDLLEEYIFRTLKKLDDRYHVEACGSFRRGAESSGSLGIVISHPDFKVENDTGNLDNFLKKFVDDLKIKGFCDEYFPMELCKYLAICRIPPLNATENPYLRRKIELRVVPYKNYWLTVLAKTGDDVFYKSLQKRALEKGFQLSDTILARIDPSSGMVGESLIVNSENDIFKILNTRYLKPEDRDWKSPL